MMLSGLPLLLEHSGRFNIDPVSPLSLLLLPVPLYLLRRRGESTGYLLCFSLFLLYAWAVACYTLLDLPLDPVEIAVLRGRVEEYGWSRDINLIPTLMTGRFHLWDVEVYGNFLLGVPFGVGLPFLVARSTHRRMVLAGLGFAAGIEVAQLLIGLLVYQAPYRILDIDDVWLVFAGTLAGYGALWVAARTYQRIGWERGARLPVWSHFHEVLLRVASNRAPPIDRPGHEERGDHRTSPRTDAENPQRAMTDGVVRIR